MTNEQLTHTTDQLKEKEDQYTLRSIVNNVNPFDKEGRIPQGSRREFHLNFISKNWAKDNQTIGSILGITSGSVSRLRKSVRERPQMLELAFNDFMELKDDPEIPKATKFQMVTRLLIRLLDADVISKDDIKNKVSKDDADKILRAFNSRAADSSSVDSSPR